ncbi:MAG: sugar phosphate nucleotidyltransferase [Thermoanaerobaculum sp.]
MELLSFWHDRDRLDEARTRGRALPVTGMLLAAGLGERMEPLSSFLPKPALPVLGAPLLASSLGALVAAGARRVVVNLHRHPELVAQAVRQLCPPVPVMFSYEPQLLGPAGGLAAARAAFGDGPVLVANADCWSELDLAPLLASGSQERVVLGVVPHPDRGRWGAVHLDGAGRVVGFSGPGENLEERGFLFTGFQLLGSETLALLPDPPAPMAAFWRPLMEKGLLFGVEVKGVFREAGNPLAYRELVMEVLGEGVFASPLAAVSSTAHLARTAVEAGAGVGPGASLSRCVLLPQAEVGAGARLSGCVVAGPVPAGAVLEDALVTPRGTFPLAA